VWFLACHRDSDDGPRTLVEDIVTQNQHGTMAGLFPAANGIEVGPADVTP
jgi:hypothetical protein